MKEEIKIYGLSWQAFQEYRKTVKGNRYTSYEVTQKKLSRNVACGVKRWKLLNWLLRREEYVYGAMKILVRDDEIIKVVNHIKDPIKGWKKDYQKYIRISKALRIPYNKDRDQVS